MRMFPLEEAMLIRGVPPLFSSIQPDELNEPVPVVSDPRTAMLP